MTDPAAGYLVDPPRRHWWLWGLVLVAVGLLVAGGVGVALAVLRPHRSVVDVPVAAGLPRAQGDAQATAEVLLRSVAGDVGRHPVALAYEDARSPVYLVGGSLGSFDDADTALRKATGAFATSAFRSGTGPVPFTDEAAGARGGRTRCASISVPSARAAVCGWADSDTVGLAVSPLRTPAELATLLARLRADVER